MSARAFLYRLFCQTPEIGTQMGMVCGVGRKVAGDPGYWLWSSFVTSCLIPSLSLSFSPTKGGLD